MTSSLKTGLRTARVFSGSKTPETAEAMKKSRYSPEQVIYALKQVNEGEEVAVICRKMGISEATFYNWKKP
jgi:coenzyme F420-reducing hydrogenase beta subunit